MKKCFSDEQIICILREACVSARELCRKHAISDATVSTPVNLSLLEIFQHADAVDGAISKM
ncbi:hypothetical protein [Pectobacterium carotovorum]|uniref:hypothetical protein n=1 Tax=Pectobacterium carotovorum TaxID=554 RepID=UPI0038141FF4